MQQSLADYKGVARAAWILLLLVCLISLIPILGFAAWFIAGPVLLTSFILGVIAISRGGTLQGVLILLCAVIAAPIFIIVAPLVTSAIGIQAASVNPKISAPAAIGFSAPSFSANPSSSTLDYSPSYLSEMPSVERVTADMQTSDFMDTTARRDGAFNQLKNMMEVMSNGRIPFGGNAGTPTPQELQLYQAYNIAAAKAQGDAEAKFNDQANAGLGMNSPRAKWFGQETEYETGNSFRDELLKRYFSADWQARYMAELKAKR
jgi:hypothetical protein